MITIKIFTCPYNKLKLKKNVYTFLVKKHLYMLD